MAGLSEAVRAHLVREVDNGPAAACTYYFGHDRIRDVVHAEAGDARRRVLNRRALDALQSTAPAAQLAGHAMAAGLEESAAEFSPAAGDEVMRLLAARDALVHYERALEVAKRAKWAGLVADLHARRGKAYASVAQWADARRELEAALDGLDANQAERRTELLTDLLEVCWWLLDVPNLRRAANETLMSAEALGRGDLETAARGWLAAALGAEGDLTGCVVHFEQASARGRELGLPPPAAAYSYSPLPLFWLGRLEEAVVRGEESVQVAREANHTSATMFSLPNYGLALAASGRYRQAVQVFDEARHFGRQYGIETLLARAIAMSAGLHLDLFDFAGNEALAEEARDLARSRSFPPPAVSAGLDLMLNFARQRDVGRTERLIDEVAAAAAEASGWHGWFWNMRLAQARAEIALARGDWDGGLQAAGDSIEQSRARGRAKYEVLGLGARAHALLALGRARQAIPDLRMAIALARKAGDPALFLRAAADLLAVDGHDALAAEAANVVRQIRAALPDARMRGYFEAAEPVALVLRSAGATPA